MSSCRECVHYRVCGMIDQKVFTPSERMCFLDRTKVMVALEKQTPRRTIEDGYVNEPVVCPGCGYSFCFCKSDKVVLRNLNMFSFCPDCGQAIDWAEVEE